MTHMKLALHEALFLFGHRKAVKEMCWQMYFHDITWLGHFSQTPGKHRTALNSKYNLSRLAKVSFPKNRALTIKHE